MVYYFEISRNRHLLLLPLFAAILVAVSLMIAILWKPIIGLPSLLVTTYLGYHLAKYFRSHVKSVIHVTDEGVHGITCIGSKFSFRWENLSLAGKFSNSGKFHEVFLYSNKDDQLIRIPYLYSRPDDMILEIEEQATDFVCWEGSDREDLEISLKKRFDA